MSDNATAIVALLATVADRTGIPTSRIAPVGMPDKVARPNIVYQIITNRPVIANDGPADLSFGSVQLSIYTDTYSAARTAANVIAAPYTQDGGGLNGYSGTIGGMKIQSLILDDDRDAPEPPASGQSSGIAGVILVFNFATSNP
jgi:hypothetical protein